jgi:hypothetical protein
VFLTPLFCGKAICMRFKIVDVPVRQNIELFLDLLRRSKQKLQHREIPSEKIFKAWLNRETGQLLFAEVAKESLFLAKEEWKPIDISYRYDLGVGEIIFLIEEREVPLKGFRCDDLTPVAFNIVRDTMKVLNRICQNLKGPSDLETKMSVLTKLTIDGSVSHVDRNILIDAWHHVDRMGAEALLMDKPVGTYLFRRDHFSEILEQQLREQLKKPIKCFTLTFSQPNKKFCDITLVHLEGEWQYYDDDPSLKNRAFQELRDLLALWKDQLKYPLYH